MHYYGDKGVDWEGIEAAAAFIGEGLRKWRVQVRQYKEKFGTVRVYCHFGISGIHDLFYPGWAYYQWPRWTRSLSDRPYWLYRALNLLIYPIHFRVYSYYYRKAVERWPHLRKEILSNADHEELLQDLLDRCSACNRAISNWRPPRKWACQCSTNDPIEEALGI
jgi:hypothetical protein